MSKLDLIKDRCIGCGACMTIAPENFTFDDEGRAELINTNVTEEAIDASETCPVSAIIIENNCNCNEECNCGKECTCGDICNCTTENKCSENCSCGEECNSTEDKE